MFCFFFCKQKTAYEMRISDWSSDVCSSDLPRRSKPRLRFHDRRTFARSLCGGPDPHICAGARRDTSRREADALDVVDISSTYRPRPQRDAAAICRSEERSVGKSVSVSVVLWGRRILIKTKIYK